MTAATALVVFTAGAASPAPQAKNTTPVTVKVGSLKIANAAPQTVSPQIFTDNGLALDLSYATSGAAIVPGVVGGSYDIGYGSCSAVIQAVQGGLPIKIIANGDISVGNVVVLASGSIRTAKDLDSKTIATNALKSTVDLETSVSVDAQGGNASTLKFLEIPFPTQLASLDAGQVDAAVLPEPFLTQAKANPKYRVIFSIFDVKPPDVTNCYFSSNSYLSDNAAAAKRFVSAIRESNAYATTNPDQARSAIAALTGAPAAAVATITLPTWLESKPKAAEIKVLSKRMVKFEFITKAPAPSKVLWSKSSAKK